MKININRNNIQNVREKNKRLWESKGREKENKIFRIPC